jgi:hypothetical protein
MSQHTKENSDVVSTLSGPGRGHHVSEVLANQPTWGELLEDTAVNTKYSQRHAAHVAAKLTV